MRLFLCGGGSGERALEATKKFGDLIDKSKPLLYVPLAMDSYRYPSCLEWITNEMKTIGVTNIDMVTSKEELALKNYNDYCAIFIGGGNTYKLLDDIKKCGAFFKMKEFIKNNGIIFGGSAGAIILGEDIDTCKYEDNNEIIGLVDTSGFNTLKDISILCHYGKKEEQTKINIDYLLDYSRNRKILYLPERNTIFIDNDKIELIGNDNYCLFNNGKMMIINPEEMEFDTVINTNEF